MTTPYEVAGYIRSRQPILGEVQLQKLVFYTQAWNMVWSGRPLFDDNFEAWPMGPVNWSVRDYVKMGMPREPSSLSPEDAATVDAVLAHYGHMSGYELSKLTHTEDPWMDTRGDLAPGAWSDRPIPFDSMRRYYTKQAIRREGPKQPSRVTYAGDDAVLRAARLQARTWSEALSILADR